MDESICVQSSAMHPMGAYSTTATIPIQTMVLDSLLQNLQGTFPVGGGDAIIP